MIKFCINEINLLSEIKNGNECNNINNIKSIYNSFIDIFYNTNKDYLNNLFISCIYLNIK